MLPHLREEFKSFKVSMYHLIVTFLFFLSLLGDDQSHWDDICICLSGWWFPIFFIFIPI